MTLGHPRQGDGHGVAKGTLAVREGSQDGQTSGGLADQPSAVVLGRGREALGQQDLATSAWWNGRSKAGIGRWPKPCWATARLCMGR
jgi:hypothetical protein